MTTITPADLDHGQDGVIIVTHKEIIMIKENPSRVNLLYMGSADTQTLNATTTILKSIR